jgi:hypothetical protein
MELAWLFNGRKFDIEAIIVEREIGSDLPYELTVLANRRTITKKCHAVLR